ncbi:hypothetical protein GLOIN_2v1788781 [Rhizophagus clarus]|uniref:Uncharacterized protein n=1 Tax=Rhizophagus clarus TaxID=94130 RepID=A0A8H3LPZ6_9GLOM|nr:hypothetical protein GLOIN_2v1788781 [Rhizophagus clarus]
MYIMSRKESYTENELKVFEDAIIDWCADFKKIFSTLSVTECSFPKLHSWQYYAVVAIRKYEALNGLSTEIYETLHKYYVKNPYHSSNQKEVMKQIVKRKELTPSDRKLVYCKTTGFRKFLWKLSLNAIDIKIKSLKKSNNPPHENIIKGLSQVILTLDTFLDTSSQESENDEFCKEWFSDVAVTPAEDQEQYSSAEESWYGKVSLSKEPYELALVRWYDIFPEQSKLYGCPQLHYTKEYNAIPIGSIYQEAHVIPRFDKDNRFLLNKHIF